MRGTRLPSLKLISPQKLSERGPKRTSVFRPPREQVFVRGVEAGSGEPKDLQLPFIVPATQQRATQQLATEAFTIYHLPTLDAELANTVFAGKLHFAAVTDSTNNDAMTAARAGAVHGSVYFADAQSAGKGRGGHAWLSTAGEGLYASVVLRPAAPQLRWSLLPLCTGLAAISAIRTATNLTPDLRWPNDVLLGPAKVCGILVEAGTDQNGQPFAVTGVGINVHQRSFPTQLATPATSLDLETGGLISRQKLLVALLESLQQHTAGLADEAAPTRVLAALEAASTWVCGRRVEVHGPQACTGLTDGLDPHGFLRVLTAEGLVTVQTGGIRAAQME